MDPKERLNLATAKSFCLGMFLRERFSKHSKGVFLPVGRCKLILKFPCVPQARCTCNQMSCTSAKPQQCSRAAAGRCLLRLYLGNDGRAGFGCRWGCPNHNIHQRSVLLGPVVPKRRESTGSLCLAFPAVIHLEAFSHTFSQANPGSFFCSKKQCPQIILSSVKCRESWNHSIL